MRRSLPAKRDASGRFLKGHSGNPAGRRKLPEEIKEIFLTASPDAARLLVEFMHDTGLRPELRRDCAQTILDKTFGKGFQILPNDQGDTGILEEIIKAVQIIG